MMRPSLLHSSRSPNGCGGARTSELRQRIFGRSARTMRAVCCACEIITRRHACAPESLRALCNPVRCVVCSQRSLSIHVLRPAGVSAGIRVSVLRQRAHWRAQLQQLHRVVVVQSTVSSAPRRMRPERGCRWKQVRARIGARNRWSSYSSSTARPRPPTRLRARCTQPRQQRVCGAAAMADGPRGCSFGMNTHPEAGPGGDPAQAHLPGHRAGPANAVPEHF